MIYNICTVYFNVVCYSKVWGTFSTLFVCTDNISFFFSLSCYSLSSWHKSNERRILLSSRGLLLFVPVVIRTTNLSQLYWVTQKEQTYYRDVNCSMISLVVKFIVSRQVKGQLTFQNTKCLQQNCCFDCPSVFNHKEKLPKLKAPVCQHTSSLKGFTDIFSLTLLQMDSGPQNPPLPSAI